MDLSTLVLLTTVSGYGDPVDGFPSHDERKLLLWTNAARVAPEEFDQEYQAGYEPCSFDDFLADEQEPKAPMYIDLALTEVARVHSTDMLENGCFQHESCDGTDTWDRIGGYYTESSYLGENIAMGTTDPRYAVMGMWMCSDGHRANIMNGDYNEMGPGVDSSYLTQDFSQGTLAEGDPPVRMGVDDSGVFYADWGDADPPKGLQLVMEGVTVDMELTYGVAEQGIYSAEAPESVTDDCRGWYVWWQTASGREGTFPEGGSWLDGACDGEDWVGEQAMRGGLFGDVSDKELHGAMLDDLSLVGCSSSGGMSGIAGVFAGIAAVLRRRA